MLELLSKMVEKIRENNVIQVITDNAANLKAAGRYLECKYPHLYWTPCAAHCLDLMLEDIGKLAYVKRTLQRAMKLTGFIYAHGLILNMMRDFTNKELLRPAMTRFATSYLTLVSIHKQKNNLKKMFVLERWLNSRWAKEKDPKEREAANIVMMPSFWNSVTFILKVTSPLVRVLRLVDSERKSAMGYIYEAMERAKEAIMNVFQHREDKYKDIFEIIDKRWGDQFHRPLHAAVYYLNPEFFYDNKGIQADEEVMSGLYNVIEKLTREQETQDKIDRELALYRNASSLFGINMAVRNRKKKWPVLLLDSTFYFELLTALLPITTDFPGSLMEMDEDVSRLKSIAVGILSDSGLHGSTLSEDLIHEVCRYGGAELHAVAAFIGGIASQEVIKLVTKQFVPITGTLVFNGIDHKSQVLML